MNAKPFDLAHLDSLVDNWATSACERLDQMIDADASVIDIRDASIFFAGTLAGQLGALQVPISAINTAAAKFQDAMDSHLMKRLPQHPPNLWQHNANLH